MDWIVKAAIFNTIWTLLCITRAPARLITKFAADGRAAGSMSRGGFAVFSLVFPLILAGFMVLMGRSVNGAAPGMGVVMEHFAAGLIVFFSMITWCIVRSNRNSPAKLDKPTFVLAIASLVVFMFFFARELPKETRHSAGQQPVGSAEHRS